MDEGPSLGSSRQIVARVCAQLGEWRGILSEAEDRDTLDGIVKSLVATGDVVSAATALTELAKGAGVPGLVSITKEALLPDIAPPHGFYSMWVCPVVPAVCDRMAHPEGGGDPPLCSMHNLPMRVLPLD